MTMLVSLVLTMLVGNAQADFLVFGRNDASNAHLQVWSNPSKLALRYRYQTDGAKNELKNDVQYHLNTGFTLGAFKNRVRIEAHGRTGPKFAGSWPPTGLGTSDGAYIFGFRRLNLGLGPWAGFDVQVGSMGVKYGKGSEDTFLDKDGWVMGYRARYSTADWGIVSTTGYLADTAKDRKVIDVYNRFDRMGDFNYNHTMYTRNLSSKVGFSLGYVYYRPGDVNHYGKAAMVHKVGGEVIDSYGAELTYKIQSRTASATAVHMSRKFAQLIGDLDLKTTLKYLHKSVSFDLPTNDKVLSGHSGWLNLVVPGVWKTKMTSLGIFAVLVQNFSDTDARRVELGAAMKF